MEKKITRSIEVSRLLNPAFCGQIVLHCIKKYENFLESGLPHPLVFFIIPLILHSDTRQKIPIVTRTKFHSWLMQNQSILIDFHSRVQQLVHITKETLVFLSYYDLIKFENGILKTNNFNPKTKQSESLEIEDCFKKSQTLGKLFSTAGKPSTVYSLLGVTL